MSQRFATETEHWTVVLGSRTDLPKWHVLREPSSTSFPTEEAAFRFAAYHKQEAAELGLDRRVEIHYPDGTVKPLELGLIRTEDGKLLSMFGEIYKREFALS